MQTDKIGRQFRPEPQDLTARGVLDGEYMGVKGLSAKSRQRRLASRGQKCRFGAKTRPIGGVAHHRMTNCRKVDPDLVGPAGFQPAEQEAGHGLPVLNYAGAAKSSAL